MRSQSRCSQLRKIVITNHIAQITLTRYISLSKVSYINIFLTDVFFPSTNTCCLERVRAWVHIKGEQEEHKTVWIRAVEGTSMCICACSAGVNREGFLPPLQTAPRIRVAEPCRWQHCHSASKKHDPAEGQSIWTSMRHHSKGNRGDLSICCWLFLSTRNEQKRQQHVTQPRHYVLYQPLNTKMCFFAHCPGKWLPYFPKQQPSETLSTLMSYVLSTGNTKVSQILLFIKEQEYPHPKYIHTIRNVFDKLL